MVCNSTLYKSCAESGLRVKDKQQEYNKIGMLQDHDGSETLDVCQLSRHFGQMLIYKILTNEQFITLNATGRFDGAEIDLADGYLHTSTAAQTQETTDKHFRGTENLVLIALDAATYGSDLIWEASRGGQDFPHIYGRPLLRSEMVWARPIPLVDGRHAPDLT